MLAGQAEGLSLDPIVYVKVLVSVFHRMPKGESLQNVVLSSLATGRNSFCELNLEPPFRAYLLIVYKHYSGDRKSSSYQGPFDLFYMFSQGNCHTLSTSVLIVYCLSYPIIQDALRVPG